MFRTTVLGACTAAMILTIAVSAQAQRRPQIILFQEDNFRGAQLTLDAAAPELERYRFDDRASSVRVVSGTWELCDKDRYGGRCVTVDRDVNKLNSLVMDDRTSSIRPVAPRDNGRRR